MDANIKKRLDAARNAGIDLTLIREALRLTPEQRLHRLQDWMEAAEALRKAGKGLKPIGT